MTTPIAPLDEMLQQLQQSVDAIRQHHAFPHDQHGAMKIFNVVLESIQPVLHNYKWRELMLVQLANTHLSHSGGNHGSDGKTVQEIESKSAKMSGKALMGRHVMGMYDKIGARIDFDPNVDVELLIDYVDQSPEPMTKDRLMAYIRNTTFKGQERNLSMSSKRRAERLFGLLIQEQALKEHKGIIKVGPNPNATIKWPPTLQTLGVARHEYTIFGLFGAKTGRPLLGVLCKSEDIEEKLGGVFEQKFALYSQQMDEKKKNTQHGKAASSNDATTIELQALLKLPTVKIIHLDTQAMEHEGMTVEAGLLENMKKACTKGNREMLEKYVAYMDAKQTSESKKIRSKSP